MKRLVPLRCAGALGCCCSSRGRWRCAGRGRAPPARAPQRGADTPDRPRRLQSPQLLAGFAARELSPAVQARGRRAHAGARHLRGAARRRHRLHDARWPVRLHRRSLPRSRTTSNLTEAHRRELRRKLIDAVPESQMVVFSPPQPKYTVTVFTDVDCAYCRAFHRQIADYNRLGVRVRYVFFPRTGPNTASWYKAEQVWCSARSQGGADAGQARRAAGRQGLCQYAGGAANTSSARRSASRARPGIVAANGAMVGGYLPPDALVERSCSSSSTRIRRGELGSGCAQRSSSLSLSGLPSHSLASAGGGPFSVMTGHCLASSALICLNCS